MNNNIICNNDFSYYGILIGCGVFLTCSLFYYIRSNYPANPNPNPLTDKEIEAVILEVENLTDFTPEEMEEILNGNTNTNVAAFSSENIENYITDSDYETDTTSEYQTSFHSDSDSTADFESILNDPDLFFMPNVDFDVCPIEELKFFEFNSLYKREIIEHGITDDDIREFISWYSKEDLATNWINDVFLYIINLL